MERIYGEIYGAVLMAFLIGVVSKSMLEEDEYRLLPPRSYKDLKHEHLTTFHNYIAQFSFFVSSRYHSSLFKAALPYIVTILLEFDNFCNPFFQCEFVCDSARHSGIQVLPSKKLRICVTLFELQ